VLIAVLAMICLIVTSSFVFAEPIQWKIEDGGNGHYYQYFSNDLITWHVAKSKAESMGGYLATITSPEENEWIANTFPLTTPPSHLNWIGGYQDKNDPSYSEPAGGWKWVTNEPMNYLNWHEPYQPDNWYGPGGAEDYLTIMPNGEWNDYAEWAPYLVEWDSEPSSLIYGLVAYYPFNGNADDESGNGNHGTVNGATLTTDKLGNPDSAYRFNGDDYIDIGNDDSINIAGDLTISVWANIDNPKATLEQALVGKMGSSPSGPDNQYIVQIMRINEEGRPFALIFDYIYPSYMALDDTIWPGGEWAHLVLTYEAATKTGRLYFQGELKLEKTFLSTPFPCGVNATLGATPYDDGKRYLTGCLDEVRIYNRPLSENEIMALYIEDTTPPEAKCKDITVYLDETGYVSITAEEVDDGSWDASGIDSLAVYPDSFSCDNIGENTVTLTVTDIAGNENKCEAIVIVQDVTPPVISSIVADPDMLWPPNHKMAEVRVIVDASDICDEAPVSRIIEVTCNELVNGHGDGNTEPDWNITGDLTVNLRAERSGGGDGRIYTIHLETADLSGNIVASTIDVIVPHDQGKKKSK